VDGVAGAVEQLTGLGFSQYEARAYVGLLGAEAMTGYALANHTRIPQPKVYETLRRLEDKEAVVRVGDDPARYVAVPAERLVANLSERLRTRVAEAERSLAELDRPRSDTQAHILPKLTDWDAIAGRAEEMLGSAERHVYLSAHAHHLARFASAISAAQDRGVRFDVLCFGKARLSLRNGRLLQHASTEGVVYRHHQARHLAVVADSHDGMWALAPNGDDWDAALTADPLFVALVKGYVRHDLYVQQMYADLPAELTARYGPGLQQLVRPAEDTQGERRTRGRRAAP
jgi:HTH-type transcriptional regulator, sugar sensing transcriptional regulator